MGPSPLVEVHHRLLKAHVSTHGPLDTWVQFDPVTQMIHAILDGRTRDAVSCRAFDALRTHFASWDGLLNVPADTLAQLIRPVTFAEKKAEQIREALQKIKNFCGTLDLDFLGDRPAEDARVWLENLRGVGPKVGAAVMNFSTLSMRALVVDSHYRRVANRLTFVNERASDARAHKLLSRLVPNWMTPDDLQQHYFVMKRLGQTVCHRTLPNCRACPLRAICPTGKRRCGEP